MYKECTRKKKNATILILLSILLFLPFSGFTQQISILEKPVTLEINNVSLSDALQAIGDQTGVHFSYSSTKLDVQRKVSLNVTRKSLRDVLQELLGKQLKGLSVNGEQVTIQTSSGRGSIKGEVKTRDGKPAAFVTVGVKG